MKKSSSRETERQLKPLANMLKRKVSYFRNDPCPTKDHRSDMLWKFGKATQAQRNGDIILFSIEGREFKPFPIMKHIL